MLAALSGEAACTYCPLPLFWNGASFTSRMIFPSQLYTWNNRKSNCTQSSPCSPCHRYSHYFFFFTEKNHKTFCKMSKALPYRQNKHLVSLSWIYQTHSNLFFYGSIWNTNTTMSTKSVNWSNNKELRLFFKKWSPYKFPCNSPYSSPKYTM